MERHKIKNLLKSKVTFGSTTVSEAQFGIFLPNPSCAYRVLSVKSWFGRKAKNRYVKPASYHVWSCLPAEDLVEHIPHQSPNKPQLFAKKKKKNLN